ncbi:peptidyl-prolyl cis-trans isomerase D [Thioalkalivibrio sp. ALE21]|uniref:SurA N-terminal domain-containing protein n=1 Tax=Thioalkalivibrio sp. ALE21 TaxID=1158175 RepID=UPI000D8856AF|nr:SurA N-terminal domain-containing protein [Thioalkalivibrio sp. ALE21]PYG02611.1 peptidyl-prolyl cis-trans isomerase D [Thioalkalivibrio sp. ALE21]
MLQAIRDRATGWLAYVIIGLIAVPFALWGVGEYFGGAGDIVAAEVNGVDIDTRSVHQEARAQRDELRRMFGGEIPDEFDDEGIRLQALESLIRETLLRQAADDLGFTAASESVRREIRAMPVFQEGGQFSPERYSQLLSAQRISPADFEDDIGRSLVMSQIQTGIRESGRFDEGLVDEYAALRNQVRTVSWRVFAAEDFDRPGVVDEDAVEAYYEANPEEFTTEERLRVEYLQLDPASLEEAVELSEEDIEEHYRANRSRYEEPELRDVRVIRLADEDDAEARIGELRQRIEDGEDFAELAEEYSEDSLSAPRGGRMGELARGDLGSSTLETVIFSLPEGMVSQPVRTDQGWYIIQVTAVEDARAQPLEQVRDDVESDLRDRRAEQMQIDALDDLMSLTVEFPESLEPAAEATGLEIRTTDWFTRDSGSGIADSRSVRDAAFGERVRERGENSDALDLDDGSTIVLRVAEREESELRPLAEVEDEIRSRLQAEAAADAAREAGEALLEDLREADDWAAAIEDEGSWTRSRELRRDTRDGDVPDGLVAPVFRLAAPEEDGPRLAGLTLSGGDFAVVALEAVQAGGVQEDPALRQQARDQLRNAYGGAEMRAYLAWLEAEADIQRYPENLE